MSAMPPPSPSARTSTGLGAAPLSFEQAEAALDEASRWLLEARKDLDVAVHNFGVAVASRERAVHVLLNLAAERASSARGAAEGGA